MSARATTGRQRDHVIVLSMLVTGGGYGAAQKQAQAIAEKIAAETEAHTVCIDGVYPRREIVGGRRG